MHTVEPSEKPQSFLKSRTLFWVTVQLVPPQQHPGFSLNNINNTGTNDVDFWRLYNDKYPKHPGLTKLLKVQVVESNTVVNNSLYYHPANTLP